MEFEFSDDEKEAEYRRQLQGKRKDSTPGSRQGRPEGDRYGRGRGKRGDVCFKRMASVVEVSRHLLWPHLADPLLRAFGCLVRRRP